MKETYKNSKLSARERAESLLQCMTLREKIGQLNQRLYGFTVCERDGETLTLTQEFQDEVEWFGGLGTLYGLYRADPWSKRNYENGLCDRFAMKAYNMVQSYVLEHSRLKIPMMLSTECPHGHQALDGYLLPVNLAMGATFHPELVERAYGVVGSQLKEMGVDLALVSTLDVLRDPRWGRSEECYSEDPYLVEEMGAAAIRGIQSQGVYAVAKHFCAQGEGTGGINASAARIGERELREIHYPPAKACVKAGVKGIMAAYNEIDGVYCHDNYHLLTEVLREEMGFQGVVMADGVAIDRLNTITGNTLISGANALKAGVDISLWDEAFGRLEEAVKNRYITEADIDKAALRVLTIKFERGLFETPFMQENNYWMSYNYKNYTESLELSRESIVLLKNENHILPLDIKRVSSIAVIGPNANEIYNQLGDYTPPIKEEEGITVLQGIRNYVNETDPSIAVKFATGSGLVTGDECQISNAIELAKSCDVTVLVLGGSSSRFGETQFDTNGAALGTGMIEMDCGEGIDLADIGLSPVQHKLADKIYCTNKPVITVTIQGRPYAMEEIAKNTRGLLCCFYPGIKGGQAIAELLFGKISPSGRLPVSIPRSTGQLPVYYNYKASYQGANYVDKEKSPLFSFGEGMTYTKFAYENITFNKKQILQSEINSESATKPIIIGFTIKNVGTTYGHTVPQLYVRRITSSAIGRVRELKGFQKVGLQPGEKREVTFIITQEMLSSWNKSMKYEVEKGIKEISLWDSGEVIFQEKISVM